MNPDKPSLLLQNDFCHFKTLPSSKKDKRSDTSSSAHSVSSIDSDDKDLLYAHHYFIDTTGSGRGSTSSNTSPSVSDSEAVLMHDQPNESGYIVIDSSSPTTTSSSNQPQRKRKKTDSKKGKNKKIKRSRDKGDDMELDSDVEIIREETDSAHFLVASDRQANVRARPPDKMAAEDTWYLVEKDLVGRDRYEKLHDFKRYSSRQLRCMNCKQKGHTQSDCPQSKRHTMCYLCGRVNHISSKCPDYMCQYCFKPSHRGRPCKSTLSNPRSYCKRCYVQGHSELICPEKWRQFHNTTNGNTRLTTLDPSNSRRNDAYCCSCSKNGHYVYECTQPRPRGCPFPFSPLIARYDHIQPTTTSRPQSNTHATVLATPTDPPPRWNDEGTRDASQERSLRKRSSSYSAPVPNPRLTRQASRRASYQDPAREPYQHHSDELYHNNLSNPPSPYPHPPSPYPPPRHYGGEGSGDYYNDPPPYPPSPDTYQRRPSYVSPGYDSPRRDSRGSVGDQYGNEFPRSRFSRPPTPYYETHSVIGDRRPPGGYSGSGEGGMERITIQSVSFGKNHFKRRTRISNERGSRRRTN